MKNLKFLVFTIVFFGFLNSFSAFAQSGKDDEARISRLLDSKKFIFTAETATPMGGGNIRLTSSYYQVDFLGDSLRSFLPYFGTAFRPQIGITESPLHFSSNDFTYNEKKDRKGGRTITIRINKPQDPEIMILSVSASGYGTLSITSINRQQISFYGFVDDPGTRTTGMRD